MKTRIGAALSLILSICLTGTVLLGNLPSATAADNSSPRVVYKIVSNSATPTISRGSYFEANFAFYDQTSDIKNIKVESPNNSISGLPKTFDAEDIEKGDPFNLGQDSDINSPSYSLNIPEANLKYIGKGSAILKFTIYYNGNIPAATVQKTISECQPTPTSSGTDKSDLTLLSYGVDRSGIKEGERFNLNLVVKNNGSMPNNHVTAVLDGLNPDEITVDGQLDTKTTDTIQAGETVSMTFPMICNPKMTSKNYMLKIQLSSDEAPTATTFNLFVPVTGTKAATTGDNDKSNASKPQIIIESYDYGGTSVTGGKEFLLTMNIRNTGATAIENIKMTVSSAVESNSDADATGGAFTPAKSSNTFFIPKLNGGAIIQKQIALLPKSDAAPKSYGVGIAFKYEAVLDSTRESLDAQETISIPLTQPDRFEVNEAELPGPMYLGEPGQLNINYVNKGKSKIFNLSVKLAGNFTTGDTNSYIGNIDSGTGDSFQAALNPSAEGTLNGTAVFSYEDANGTTKTLTKEFSCEVMAMETGPDVTKPNPGDKPEAAPSSPTWPYYLAGGIVLIALLITLRIVLKKRKAKKLRQLEESDDYDDIPKVG